MTEYITSEQFQNSDYKRRACRTAFNGEQAILALLRASGFEPVTQHKFHPTRRWKADVALLNEKILLEFEGGLFLKGESGHRSIQGMERDLEKYNAATALGWRVLRFTAKSVRQPGYIIGLVNQCLQ